MAYLEQDREGKRNSMLCKNWDAQDIPQSTSGLTLPSTDNCQNIALSSGSCMIILINMNFSEQMCDHTFLCTWFGFSHHIQSGFDILVHTYSEHILHVCLCVPPYCSAEQILSIRLRETWSSSTFTVGSLTCCNTTAFFRNSVTGTKQHKN